MSVAAVANILRHAPHLVKLDLSNCQGLTGRVIEHIADMAPQIKSLNLSGLRDVITDADMVPLSTLKNLEELNLNLCHRLTDDGITTLTTSEAKFKVLSFCSLRLITENSLKGILKKNAATLEYVDLSQTVNK